MSTSTHATCDLVKRWRYLDHNKMYWAQHGSQPPAASEDSCGVRSSLQGGSCLWYREAEADHRLPGECSGTILSVKRLYFAQQQDHPQRDHVNLIGEVIFPNLSLSSQAAFKVSHVKDCSNVSCS